MTIHTFIRALGKRYELPKSHELYTTIRSFSFTEKLLFSVATLVLAFSAFSLLNQVNKLFMEAIPAKGGSFTEGVIGTPRFINPVLAISDSDRDLTILVYSGLMRATPTEGLVPDLAESYSISEDGRVYTFVLKEDLMFHDGKPLTVDDVEFTIQKIQDPALRSPKRVNWDGVNVERVDNRTIRFTLKQPYAPFLENTTLGIISKEIWRDIDSEEFPFNTHNTRPIGSGPYMVADISEDKEGIPTSYTLSSFDDYALGKPFINTLRLNIYKTEEELIEAFEHRDIDNINSISPQSATALAEDATLRSIALPRIFGVFFNQNEQPLFADRELRRALDTAIDKQHIIEEVLHGYGVTLNGPLPPHNLSQRVVDETTEDPITEALEILVADGWEFDEEQGVLVKKSQPLAFSITTANIPELKAVADIVKTQWEKLGASVEIKVFEPSDLNQNIIRPRKYDALLFGKVVGRDLDLFAFWHSSQRNDPGLNIALYANITSDKLLEEARVTQDEKTRIEKYQLFQEEVQSDIPAVFLYAPDFIYVVSPKINNITLGHTTTPSERFLNVHEWYIHTENVWKIFTQN